MNWTEEQRNDVLNNLMDICANVDKFRQIIILTMADDGTMSVVQKRKDDASKMEALGMYRMMAADTEEQIVACWKDMDRPCQGEDEEI